MATSNKKLNTAALALFSSEDVLSFLSEHGSINLDDVAKQMQESRRKKLLEKHKSSIFKSKDGRWRTYVKDKETGKRRMVVKTYQSELVDYLCDYYEDDTNKDITLEELFPEWIEYKRHRVSPRTLDCYCEAWRRYYEDLEIIKIPIRLISKLQLDKTIHETIHKHEMTAHMYTNFRCIFNQCFEYAVDKGIISHNISDDVKVDRRRVLKPEVKKPDNTQVYSPAEQEAIFEIAWDYFRNRKHRVHQLVPLAVMFMFLTGLRVGEVATLKYSDIHGNRVTVSRFYRTQYHQIVEHTKGTFGARQVVLVPKAMELIDTAHKHQLENGIPSDGYIFSMDDQPADYNAIQKAFGRYCKQLGIKTKSSHKARKTYISTLIDSQVNINTICQQVGHKDPRTTYKSYCYDRSSNDEIYDAICDALS